MRIIRTRLLLFYLLFILVLSFPFLNSVPGILDDDGNYLCNFEQYAIGTHHIDEYIEGVKWLNMTDTILGVYAPSGNKVYGKTNIGDITSTLPINFYCGFSNVSFVSYSYFAGGGQGWNLFKFYAGDTLLFVLKHGDYAEPAQQCNLYEDDGVTIIAGKNPIGYKIQVHVEMHTANNSFRVMYYNYSDPNDAEIAWVTSDLMVSYGFISSITYETWSGSIITNTVWIDDITIDPSEGEISYAWEIDYPSFGDVTATSTDTINHSFASTDTIVDETQYALWSSGYMVKQVALAIDDGSDIDKNEHWLKIGDEYLAENDTIYTDHLNDRYVLVWENVNLTEVSTNLDLEFLFICRDTGDNTEVLLSTSDVDENGIVQFKYTNSNANLNGVYDGAVTMNLDLLYQVWYSWGAETGDTTINVYNESNTSEAITDWDVVILNPYTGMVYVQELDQTNPTVINTSEYGLGDRYFIVSADNYMSRTYYAYIMNGVNYSLDAYLPHEDDAQMYWLRVIGPSNAYGVDPPIYDAEIEIQRYINASVGFINITTVKTNIDGLAYVYLIPSKLYSFNVSASGYNDFYTSFVVSALEEGYEFRLTATGADELEYDNITDFGSQITFDGYISGTTFYVNYTDADLNTTNTAIYCYEWDTGNDTLSQFGSTDTRNGDNDFQVTFTGIDTEYCYQAVLFLNHSKFGFHRLSFMVCANQTGRDITSKTVWDTLFDNNYGGNPFGWSNTFAFFVMLASCFSFGQRNSGVGMMLTGGVLLFVNYIIGLHIMGVMIPFIFITLGIVVQWSNHRREN